MTRKQKEYKYHYTYRITNVVEKKYYYGVHSCNCLPKEDIGVKYFSSSKNKAFKDDIKENPQNYKYKVVKIFSTRKEALEHEIFLHAKFNVGVNKKFYNGAKQTSTGFDTTGLGVYIDEYDNKILITKEEAKNRGLKGATTGKHPWNKDLKMSDEYNALFKIKLKNSGRTYIGENNPNYGKVTPDEVKEKIRLGNLGKTLSDETKQKMSESRSGENHWNYGKNHSEETKTKMRKPKSEEAKENMKKGIAENGGRSGEKNSFYGKKHTEDSIEKMKKPRQKLTCPHCNKIGGNSNMKRYHFDNCKSINLVQI
jgi:hypothetical protein